MSELDAIKARAEYVSDKSLEAMSCHLAEIDIPALVAAVEAVLELHKEVQWKESWPTCIHCNSGEGSPLAYPCPTVTAINQALGEGQ